MAVDAHDVGHASGAGSPDASREGFERGDSFWRQAKLSAGGEKRVRSRLCCLVPALHRSPIDALVDEMGQPAAFEDRPRVRARRDDSLIKSGLGGGFKIATGSYKTATGYRARRRWKIRFFRFARP